MLLVAFDVEYVNWTFNGILIPGLKHRIAS
jgi:hypothetical protein